jgi:hypothetical protein
MQLMKQFHSLTVSAIAAALLLYGGSAVHGYQYVYNASDFAIEVTEYVQGGSVPTDWFSGTPFTVSESALGRPTVDTTGDNTAGSPYDPVTVVPVYPSLRVWELVSIGQGGSLILKFDHPVIDDPRNPCGIDFIVFGNSKQSLGGSTYWTNGNPASYSIGSSYIDSEPGTVSIAQNHDPQNPGQTTWYTFTDGPSADDWVPTLGRIYDPENAPVGQPNNGYWGAETNPLIPFNPQLGPADFSGQSVAWCAQRYGYSAGGTGFDLADVGLTSFQYIRIENPLLSGYTTEIDAVADVDPTAAAPDFDCDADVDLDDITAFEACRTAPGVTSTAAGCERMDIDYDGDVDQMDFAVLQRCISGPDFPADPNCKD